ncbi:hypothetical protein Tco_1218138 [Tanacetum coccineum]
MLHGSTHPWTLLEHQCKSGFTCTRWEGNIGEEPNALVKLFKSSSFIALRTIHNFSPLHKLVKGRLIVRTLYKSAAVLEMSCSSLATDGNRSFKSILENVYAALKADQIKYRYVEGDND